MLVIFTGDFPEGMRAGASIEGAAQGPLSDGHLPAFRANPRWVTMMTVDTQSEQRALDEAVGRLSERFPSVDRDTVAKIVQEEYASLSGAKVRDYIPVLAENAATDRLRKVAKMVQPVVPENLGEFEPVDAETRLDPYEIQARSQRPALLDGDLTND
jgi:hypothetical protein